MAEKIMDFYKGTDEYSDGEIEKEILKYIKTTTEDEFENIFEKDNRWPVFYHLSPIRQNIINWYDIDKNLDVLEIGAGMGAITGVLCQKAKTVTAVELSNHRAEAIYTRYNHYDNLKIIVGNLNDITFNKKFDIITLIGVLEYAKMFTQGENPFESFLKNIKKLLKPNGKLLIAIENKYGLKYWCGASEDHTGKAFDGINGYKNNENIKTFDKKTLQEMLQKSGLNNMRFYYPEPDYKFPNYIFTDKSLPTFNITSKIKHYYQPGSILIAEEKEILDDVVKNNAYDFFANSFLVEASAEKIDNTKNPNMVVFNNERKPEYRLITSVYNDTVYKKPQNLKAIPHLYTIMENTKELKFRGINIIENKLEDNKLSLPFVEEPTFDKIIIDLILNDKIDEAKELVNKFKLEILKSSEKTTHNALLENKIIDENCDIDFRPILKKGFVDMTFFNCFYINGEFVFMDQEWVQYDVPVEYVLFRSFYCVWMQCKEISNMFTIANLLKKFNFNPKMFQIGEKFNQILCNNIFNLFNVIPFHTYLSSSGKWKTDFDNKTIEEKNTLINQNFELSQQNSELINQNSELSQQNSELINQNSELSQQNSELINQNSELSQQNSELINQNSELSQQNSELINQNSELSCQSKQYKNLYIETINSACWKFMSPVRVVLNILKRILISNRFTLLLYKFLVSCRRYGLKQTIFKVKNKINQRKNISNHNIKIDAYNLDNINNDIIKEITYYTQHKSPYYIDYNENKETIITDNDVKLIAFYLPQFHTFQENDRWWGRGFTEWTNVTKCTPKFIGHYQPQLPIDVGFYDLSNINVMKRQVQLAKQYGISGFCFHYYWFNGKRLMEKPLNNFLNNKNLDLKFCICWANENWTRKWDGQENDILIAQQHSDEDDLNCIKDLSQYIKDDRYIKVNGKPLIIIYRGDLFPNIKNTLKIWRKYCQECGIGEIHIVGAKTFNNTDPLTNGFDMGVEFPPHHLTVQTLDVKKIENQFNGLVYDMNYFVTKKQYLQNNNYTYKTVFPSWDNCSRNSLHGHVLKLTPFEYKQWLIDVMKLTQKTKTLNNLVFINAWNEWAEGAHLEPDRYYGYAYLEMTSQAIKEYKKKEPLITIVAPSYNHEKFIEKSLKSVANQTYENKELIIIDDFSTDQTTNIIENLINQNNFKNAFTNITFIKHNKNQGSYNSINEGLSKAKGQYITIINTDDLYEANRLDIMISSMISNNSDISFSSIKVIDNNGNFNISPESKFFKNTDIKIKQAGSITRALLDMNLALSTGNIVFSTRILKNLIGFRDFSYIHDWDFLLRATLIQEPLFIDKTNYLYRIHDNNTFKKLQEDKKDSFTQVQEVLSNIQKQIDNGNYTNPKFKNINWSFYC